MTSSDLDGHFSCLKALNLLFLKWNTYSYRIYLPANQQAQLSYNFNIRMETEELLKVKGSHVLCITGNISDTVQNSNIVTIEHQ